MGENSKIEWTNHTWNPWQGCHKVSGGCKFCYMYREKERYGQDPNVVVRSSPSTFNKPLRWKDPAMVFTCSWSDFFIEEADEWRDEAWEIIRNTPHLTYQILTKRPRNIPDRLPSDWYYGWKNVWLGVSIEKEVYLTRRIWEMAKVWVPVHFISAEPLLGPLDLRDYLKVIEWVIVGGESGPGYRTMEIDWLRSIVDQCRKAGVPIFVKQDSGPRPGMRGNIPNDLWIQEFPE